MSLCMSSARKIPRAARFFASRSPRTPLWTTTTNSATVRCRWNSSNSVAGKVKIAGSRAKARGWSNWKVFGLTAATGITAHVLATNDARSQRVKEREYSNPGKFIEPQYANIRDMEAVSSLSHAI
jgi:hypothetical protein